jgi:hypothetical protein
VDLSIGSRLQRRYLGAKNENSRIVVSVAIDDANKKLIRCLVFGGPVILPLSSVPPPTTDSTTSSLRALNGVLAGKENHNNYSYDE